MCPHVCPWWAGYVIDNRLRRIVHSPEKILGPHVQPGMTVMDFGCGMGVFAIAMARLVGSRGHVIAVDLQPKMLQTLSKRAAKAGVAERIRTHRCEAESIGLCEAVDFALAFYSVHEVPDQERLLGEIYGYLRPGGTLLIAEPIGHVPARAFQATLSLAEEAGFRVRQRPRIRLSHAALLQKDPGAPGKT